MIRGRRRARAASDGAPGRDGPPLRRRVAIRYSMIGWTADAGLPASGDPAATRRRARGDSRRPWRRRRDGRPTPGARERLPWCARRTRGGRRTGGHLRPVATLRHGRPRGARRGADAASWTSWIGFAPAPGGPTYCQREDAVKYGQARGSTWAAVRNPGRSGGDSCRLRHNSAAASASPAPSAAKGFGVGRAGSDSRRCPAGAGAWASAFKGMKPRLPKAN